MGYLSLPADLADRTDEDDAISFTDDLIDWLIDMQSTRVLFPSRGNKPIRLERLIDLLDPVNDPRGYRRLVRMAPGAFDELLTLLHGTEEFYDTSRDVLAEMLSVVLYRFGHSGNGASVAEIARGAGISEGSVISWSKRVGSALAGLRHVVLTWATEGEKAAAKQWIEDRIPVPSWIAGFCAVDGTHIKLTNKPGINAKDYFNYKRFYSFNVQLVVLPHSLRIIEYVVGYKGSAQDSRAWAGGSALLREPGKYLELDNGEFIWADGGYGLSPFVVGPYSHKKAELSVDLRMFNWNMSRIWVRVEHAISCWKARFQRMKEFTIQLNTDEHEEAACETIIATMVAHTIAQKYDARWDMQEFLSEAQAPTEAIAEILRELEVDPEQREENAQAWQRRAEAEARRKEATRELERRLGTSAMQTRRKADARDKREDLHQDLFLHLKRSFCDTTFDSRMKECRATDLQMSQADGQHRSASQSRSQRSRSVASRASSSRGGRRGRA
ncbi:Predicted transposase [Ceraceosorus bombacis]|uniref:Predicted transposase n=1 Tax=Ceraceosorus bombacis TaxID=401625 RepID=A0A0P1BPI2_9BASI|nr:Predicted transposase [Ceraceosorus bombacis]